MRGGFCRRGCCRGSAFRCERCRSRPVGQEERLKPNDERWRARNHRIHAGMYADLAQFTSRVLSASSSKPGRNHDRAPHDPNETGLAAPAARRFLDRHSAVNQTSPIPSILLRPVCLASVLIAPRRPEGSEVFDNINVYQRHCHQRSVRRAFRRPAPTGTWATRLQSGRSLR